MQLGLRTADLVRPLHFIEEDVARRRGHDLPQRSPTVHKRLSQKQKPVRKLHSISCGLLGTTDPAGRERLNPAESRQSMTPLVPTSLPAASPTSTKHTPSLQRQIPHYSATASRTVPTVVLAPVVPPLCDAVPSSLSGEVQCAFEGLAQMPPPL